MIGEMGLRVAAKTNDRLILVKSTASISNLDELKRLIDVHHTPEPDRKDLIDHFTDCFKHSFVSSKESFLSSGMSYKMLEIYQKNKKPTSQFFAYLPTTAMEKCALTRVTS